MFSDHNAYSEEIMRLFYAIGFDEKTKALLFEKQNTLKPKALKANFTRRENLHLTLRFMGEVEDVYFSVLKKIQDFISSKQKSFELRIFDFGIFGRGHKSIVWAGIAKNPELLKLHDVLEKEICLNGFIPDTRPYNPHITLAREFVSDENINRVIDKIKPINHCFEVKSISLMESTRVNGKLTYLCRYRTELRS